MSSQVSRKASLTGYAVVGSVVSQLLGKKVQRRQLARVDDRLARKRWDAGNESCHVAINTKITNIKQCTRLQSRRGGQDGDFRVGETCSPPTGELYRASAAVFFFLFSLLACWIPLIHPPSQTDACVSFSSAARRGGGSLDGHASFGVGSTVVL